MEDPNNFLGELIGGCQHRKYHALGDIVARSTCLDPDRKHAFHFFHNHLISLDWASIIWCFAIPSSYSFIY